MPSAHPNCRRWMLYALGGGMGHLNRAVALTRAAVNRSGNSHGNHTKSLPKNQICLLTNSPFADCLSIIDEIGPDQQVIALKPGLSRDETAARVQEVLQAVPFDALIVDSFPRGLGGELTEILPNLNCPKILIHRDINPRYIAQAGLSEFVNHYDRLILPGESAPFEGAPSAVKTDPWLIRDDRELLAPAEARRKLQVESDTIPVVAVIGCGKESEADEMHSLAIRLAKKFNSTAAVRFITPRAHNLRLAEDTSNLVTVCLWPLLQAIRGVTVLVGSGGYNTVHEARATGTRFIGLPRQRLYDLQHRRLEPVSTANNFTDVQNYVANAIRLASELPFNHPIYYPNGVHEAVKIIESLSP